MITRAWYLFVLNPRDHQRPEMVNCAAATTRALVRVRGGGFGW